MGPSGSGKTSAIECIAHEMKHKLLFWPSMDEGIQCHTQYLYDRHDLHLFESKQGDIGGAFMDWDLSAKNQSQIERLNTFLNIHSKQFGLNLHKQMC